MIVDALLLVLFLGMVSLLCWLGFRISHPRHRRDSGLSDRHRIAKQAPPTSDDASSRITPPA
jgi:hypothetical protein